MTNKNEYTFISLQPQVRQSSRALLWTWQDFGRLPLAFLNIRISINTDKHQDHHHHQHQQQQCQNYFYLSQYQVYSAWSISLFLGPLSIRDRKQFKTMDGLIQQQLQQDYFSFHLPVIFFMWPFEISSSSFGI